MNQLTPKNTAEQSVRSETSLFRRVAFVAPILSLGVFAALLIMLVFVLKENSQRTVGQMSFATNAVSSASENANAPIAAVAVRIGEVGEGGATAGPLRVSSANPRYFADATGQIVYLSGSHTWLNLQDGTPSDPPAAFDYTTWLDFLVAHDHNFFRLWRWEQSWKVVEWAQPYYFTPHPYVRSGPGNALDGKPKFDLTQFNQAYFDRMRARIIAARERGIYVSVMLFDGWSVDYPKGFYNAANPWSGHPFNAANNINGINGDPNNDQGGQETHTLAVPAVTAIQDAYVRKVIDTVNDLDNVLYEVSNESHGDSQAWQAHMIALVKSYEATKPYQHPVGMTVEWPNGSNSDLFNSDADWVSLNGDLNNPPTASGAKVIIADTDHLCGICGDRKWVWKSFTRGENPLFMDQYDDLYELEGGGYDLNNANDVSLRRNLGYTRAYAQRINLAQMTPQPSLASSGYVLAYAAAQDAEYLVYLPTGGQVEVDLSATPGPLNVEWFNPQTGATTQGAPIDGGAQRSLAPPFPGDATLYLFQTKVTPPTYKLMLPTLGSGSAVAEPPGPYLGGQVITLTATPDAGWSFDGWSGDVVSSDNPTTFTISADAVVTATFVEEPPLQYTVTIHTVGDGSVTIDPSQDVYTSGQAITLTAVPTTGWTFIGWSGDATGIGNPKNLTIVADTVVTATFAEKQESTYHVVASTVGQGSVHAEPLGPYASGQVVTVTATPADGWQFDGWSGDIITETNPLTLTIMADTALTATFSLEPLHSFFQYLPIIQADSTHLARLRGAQPFLISLTAKSETYPRKDPQR